MNITSIDEYFEGMDGIDFGELGGHFEGMRETLQKQTALIGNLVNSSEDSVDAGSMMETKKLTGQAYEKLTKFL